MRVRQETDRIGRWLRRPLRDITALDWIIAATAFVLEFQTDSRATLAALVAIQAVALGILNRLRVLLFAHSVETKDAAKRPRRRGNRVMLGAGIIAALRFDLWFHLMVWSAPLWLSPNAAELEKTGHHLYDEVPMGSPSLSPPPGRIGRLWVRETSVNFSGVYFEITGVGTLLYSPLPDAALPLRPRRMVHLSGPWYLEDDSLW